jgi:hypothetical protein
VGEALRSGRVGAKLSLEDVSAATRISVRFLKAIEAEEFDVLPGLIFTRNFVKQYAAVLKLDPGPLLSMLPRFDLDAAPMPQAHDRPKKSWWDSRWNSALGPVAWTLLACGAAVGAYMHFSLPARRMAARFTTVQAAPAHEASKPVPVPVTPQPPPAALDSHPVQVAIRAKEDAWVQATADGKTLFATLLKAGETRPVDADGWVKIRTGNAGGIDLSLNGRPLDSLGPAGQVRSVTLTAAGPQVAPVVQDPQTPSTGDSPL